MTTANFPCCTFDGDLVQISLDYDISTLLIVDVNYQNLSPQNSDVVITVTATHKTKSYVLPANTQPTTQNISADGYHLQGYSGVNPKTGQNETWVGWPSGVTVSFQWPS